MAEWWLIGGFIVLLLGALLALLYPFRRSALGVSLLAPLFFSVVAFGYWRWGAWPDWNRYIHQEARQKQVQALLQSIKNPEDLIQRLKKRVEAEPNRAQGWYLLGRLYASQHQWESARDAYFKAHQLKPAEARITVNYAQSLWELHHQTFDNEIRQLLGMVLKKNENQPDALAMLAMDAFLGHAYQQAIDYWQRLLTVIPPQSADAAAIRKAIVRAEQRL